MLPLTHSLDHQTAKGMKRRTFLSIFAGASTRLLAPAFANGRAFAPGHIVMLRCLGNIPGPPWLDGRTQDGSVGLAPDTSPRHSGTRWEVADAGVGAIALRCLGDIPGSPWLDGRTKDGSVGLAPSLGPPYTGARWQVADVGGGAIALRCLGDIPGPPWLDGRTADGTVGLAPGLSQDYTGARWLVLPA